MVDYVVVTSKVMDAVFVSIYRPPDTSYMEWNHAVSSLMEEIDLIQANGSFQRVFIGGDLNFREEKWAENGEMVAFQGMGRQQELLYNVCNKFFLTNWVNKATRVNQ